MKNRISFYTLIFILANVLSSCTQKSDTSSRSYFTFDLKDRKVVIPVELNDSVRVKLMFDTGFGAGVSYILLDSTILETKPDLTSGTTPISIMQGSGWNVKAQQQTLIYNSSPKLKIGNTDFTYGGMMVMDWKKQMNSNVSEGMFNIPKNDTTHIWELNFENNYMEVHLADTYVMPVDCFVTPLIEFDGFHFFVDLPLRIRFMNNDTLTMNRRFAIDTGDAWDIVCLCNSQELKLLNEREDAVWIRFLRSYVRYYTADVTLLDGIAMDSMRIYTIDYPNLVNFTDYTIGLNFLKRFNVFFDMKNRQLGLQPIKNFRRLVNPLYERFHYSTHKTQDGRFIINQMGRYKENYYRTAGLRMRDEIVAIDKIPYKEITREVESELKKRDSLTFDIVRRGKPLSIVVKIDPNEPKGD